MFLNEGEMNKDGDQLMWLQWKAVSNMEPSGSVLHMSSRMC